MSAATPHSRSPQPAAAAGPGSGIDSSLAPIQVIPRVCHRDARGFLLKAMTGQETGLVSGVGEVYVIQSLPGEQRGHHFHRLAWEWFTLLSGQARLEVLDPETGSRQHIALSEADPVTVCVPAGWAHVVIALGDSPMWMVVAMSCAHDPADVVPFPVT